MARIRTIKPEFWTDPDIVQLPFLAQLLFIGTWNFADDAGYLEDEPDRIAMQIMPRVKEEAVIEVLEILIDQGFIKRLIAPDGTRVLKITNFNRHQTINKPSFSRLANLFREDSRSTTGVLPEGKERKGKERKGSINKDLSSFSKNEKARPVLENKSLFLENPKPPEIGINQKAEQVFQFWKKKLEKNENAVFGPKRKKAVLARLRDGYTVENLKSAISGCLASPFHQGLNDRNTKYDDLELICRDCSKVEAFMATDSGITEIKLTEDEEREYEQWKNQANGN